MSAIAGAGALVAGTWLYKHVESLAQPPEVICRASPSNLRAIASLRNFIEGRLYPTCLTFNRHFSTAIGFTRITPRFDYDERQLVSLRDGGSVGIDWLHRTSEIDAPILLLM